MHFASHPVFLTHEWPRPPVVDRYFHPHKLGVSISLFFAFFTYSSGCFESRIETLHAEAVSVPYRYGRTASLSFSVHGIDFRTFVNYSSKKLMTLTSSLERSSQGGFPQSNRPQSPRAQASTAKSSRPLEIKAATSFFLSPAVGWETSDAVYGEYQPRIGCRLCFGAWPHGFGRD